MSNRTSDTPELTQARIEYAKKLGVPYCIEYVDGIDNEYQNVNGVLYRRGIIQLLDLPASAPDIQEILAERGSRYGKFSSHAAITQTIKDVMCGAVVDTNWARLSGSQKEALDMVAHKIGRILNGDPDYVDSWMDIIGYTQLVVDELLVPKNSMDACGVSGCQECASNQEQPQPILYNNGCIVTFTKGVSYEDANNLIDSVMTLEEWQERNRNK